MPLSLYEVSVPPFIRELKILSSLLNKGVAHAPDKQDALISARLIADMGDLTYQIQRVSDTSKGLATRLCKAPAVAMEDNEKTFPELQERITKTIAVLEALDPHSTDGMENEDIVLKRATGEDIVRATDYVLKYAIPNFYFHLCMAYALLRKEGVPVGKTDYLAPDIK